jgi:membrane protein implicated in regulation of membrane protease activity
MDRDRKENMFEREINSAEDFEDRIQWWGITRGLGYFILVASIPVIISIGMIIDNDYTIWIYPALLLTYIGSESLIHLRVVKPKFRFWMKIEAYEPLLFAFFTMMIGAVVIIFLLAFMMYLISGSIELINWPLHFGGAAMFLSVIPALYLARRYRRKKFKGERIKYFHGNRPEIENQVKKALIDLNHQYEILEEGSKWTNIVPYYKIMGMDICVKINQYKLKEVIVATKITRQEDLPKAMEIERAIDSQLSTYTSKT